MNFDEGKYLTILGFALGARPTIDDLKKQWKALSRKYHPDNKDTADEAKFLEVGHAFEMLTNLEYRQRELREEMKRSKHNAGGDLDIRLHVPVTFEDAFFGRTMQLSYNRLEYSEQHKIVTGQVLEVVAHTVQYPEGAMDGFEMAFKGGGHRQGEVYGDALAYFAPMPHQKFKATGGDIVSTERFPLDFLLRGKKVDVQTMYGIRPLKIPPGTRPGDRFGFRGHGVGHRGNHVVIVDMIYPSKEDLRGGAWRGLEIDWSGQAEDDDEMKDLRTTLDRLLRSREAK